MYFIFSDTNPRVPTMGIFYTTRTTTSSEVTKTSSVVEEVTSNTINKGGEVQDGDKAVGSLGPDSGTSSQETAAKMVRENKYGHASEGGKVLAGGEEAKDISAGKEKAEKMIPGPGEVDCQDLGGQCGHDTGDQTDQSIAKARDNIARSV